MVTEVRHRFTDDVCIVGGAGHVGLPLGLAFARKGQRVTLYDVDARAVDTIAQGGVPFAEQGAGAAPGRNSGGLPWMLYAEAEAVVRQRRASSVKKWRLQCPAVVKSSEDAGDELFVFLRFPRSQWKAPRTTNALQPISEEFRRRTKSQASLPSQDVVLLLLFGLLRAGNIRLRRIHGWKEMPQVVAPAVAA